MEYSVITFPVDLLLSDVLMKASLQTFMKRFLENLFVTFSLLNVFRFKILI